MQELKERAAYLRGLIQGSDLAGDEKNRLLWEGLMDFCDGVAEDIEELEDSQTEFADYIEAIDEDLSSLEKYFYNTEDEDSDDPELLTSKDAETDDPVMELNCPHCKQELFFEDQPGNYEVVCPDCGSVVWQHFIAEHEPEIGDDPRQ